MKHGVLCPCVGGILGIDTNKSEAFTGGSNLVGTHVTHVHANHGRPVKFGDQSTFQQTLEAGIDLKLPGAKEEGIKNVSIVTWFQQLAAEMTRCSLDTVFGVLNSD